MKSDRQILKEINDENNDGYAPGVSTLKGKKSKNLGSESHQNNSVDKENEIEIEEFGLNDDDLFKFDENGNIVPVDERTKEGIMPYTEVDNDEEEYDEPPKENVIKIIDEIVDIIKSSGHDVTPLDFLHNISNNIKDDDKKEMHNNFENLTTLLTKMIYYGYDDIYTLTPDNILAIKNKL